MFVQQNKNMQTKNKYVRLPVGVVNRIKTDNVLKNIAVVSSGHRLGVHVIGNNEKKNPRDEFFIKYCVAGKGWFEVYGQRTDVLPGDLIFCTSNTAHSYGSSIDDPWEAYWVYFAGENCREYIDLMNINKEKPVVNIGMDYRLISCFSEILSVMEKGYARQYMVHASTLMSTLVSYLAIKLNSHLGLKSSQEYTVEQIIKYMTDNIDKDVNLKELAKKSNMSVDYFTKVFYDKIGFTPIDYFIRLKIQKACTLISSTHMTFKEISNALGYRDYYYFSRLFKRKEGLAPKEYRKLFKM